MALTKYLSDRLNHKAPAGAKRSSLWPELEHQWLKDHPTCEGCGGKDHLQVHHIVPFHIDRTKELDPKNLITLCESGRHGLNCHLLLGHRGNFKKVNESVLSDTKTWKDKITAP